MDIWSRIFQAVKDCKDEFSHHSAPAKKMSEYLNGQPLVDMETALADAFQFFTEAEYAEGGDVQTRVAATLAKVLIELTPERHFLFVRMGVRRIAEDMNPKNFPTRKWAQLWYFFAANNSLLRHAVQKRQLRSLAKKLCATNPGYREDYFLVDQLVFVPTTVRISHLERIKWFREVRQPKWLTQ